MSKKQKLLNPIVVPQGKERLIRLPEVMTRTGLSKPTIYRMMKDETFPANILIGRRAVAWKESVIDRFVDNGFAS